MRHILLISLLIPCFAGAETSLWRVKQGSHQVIIGGTIHLLGKSDYPLPDEFEQAFREADSLVLEADLAELSTPDNQAKLAQSLVYPKGTTLKSQINSKTYRALTRYCKASDLEASTMLTMKPSLVVITLTMAELQRLGLANSGVDQFYFDKAKKSGKPVTSLESAATQIQALVSMGKGHENELILSTIKELKSMPKFTLAIKQAWRNGNLAELEQIGIKTMQTEFPEMNQTLLTTRNNAWLPKIKAMLATPGRELILVGTLHLAGKDGVLAQLQQQGYVVEQY